MGKTKRFTKNPQDVRHFKLVSRSQHDPNAGDRDATPLVLEAFVKPNEPRRTGLAPEQLVEIPESLQGVGAKVFGRGEAEEVESGDEDVETKLEELDGDCYFPRDGYNYEKHLRTISTAGKEKIEKDHSVMLVEPDGAKAAVAAAEADTLALARAKAKELAPELLGAKKFATEADEALAALDDADEYEDIDDDEFAGLLASGTAVEPELVLWGRLADDDMPDLEAFKAMHKARVGLGADDDMPELDEESMQQMIAAHKKEAAAKGGEPVDPKAFELLMDDEYDDEEIGDLEEHDLQEEGIGEDELDGILDEYFEEKKTEQKYLKSMNDPRAGMSDTAPRMIEQTKAIIAMRYETLEDDAATDPGDEETTEDGSRDFDCESVLSTLSNVSNRPGRIGKIKVVKKPATTAVAPIKEGKEDEEEEESEEEEIVELPDVITERKKDETPEEKRARKQSVKQMRKVCREMKKESKAVYKGEAAKLNKPGNNDVRSGLRTQKL